MRGLRLWLALALSIGLASSVPAQSPADPTAAFQGTISSVPWTTGQRYLTGALLQQLFQQSHDAVSGASAKASAATAALATSAGITGALGFTPVNKSGDTMSGPLNGVLGESRLNTAQTTYGANGYGMSIRSGPDTGPSMIGLTNGNPLPQYDAFQSVVTVGPGQQGVGQVSAIAGYARGRHAPLGGSDQTAYPVAGFFFATAEADGEQAFGINSVVSDNATTTVGTGAGRYETNEYDFNVFNSGTIVTGNRTVGNFQVNPLTSFAHGCALVQPTTAQWSACYTADDGATAVFASIGSTTFARTKNDPSQVLNFNYKNNFGAARTVSVGAQSDGAGGAVLRVSGGSSSADGFIVTSPFGIRPASGTAATLGSLATYFTAAYAGAYFENLATPASSSDPCTPGQFGDDANFHYVCAGPNHWRRVALGDF